VPRTLVPLGMWCMFQGFGIKLHSGDILSYEVFMFFVMFCLCGCNVVMWVCGIREMEKFSPPLPNKNSCCK
jgi:hypothetical protein